MKKRGDCKRNLHSAQYFFRVMKVVLFLVFVLMFQVKGDIYSQNQLISLKLKNCSVEEFLREVKNQTGLQFIYKSEFVRNIPRFDVEANKKELKQLLDDVFAGTGVECLYEDDEVIVLTQKQTVQTTGQAGDRMIKGHVTDHLKNPLPGVTIMIKGTSIGVITDIKGNFNIVIPEKYEKILAFSFVGMKIQEIKCTDKTELHVVMEESATEIEEVVITGYQVVTRENFVGSATTLRGEDVMVAGEMTLEGMLQGVVPGMTVQYRSGMLGSTPKVKIRGTSTILGDSEPLWVVDGIVQQSPQVPYKTDGINSFSSDAQALRDIAANAISWLNPQDINTITVLKDASATAIYGSKAANGVIVITTKKAAFDQTNISYNTNLNIRERPGYQNYNLMNSQERMNFSREMYEQRIKYPGQFLPLGYEGISEQLHNKEITEEQFAQAYNRMERQNTDWFKELFRTPFSHNHNLSVSHATEKVSIRASVGFNSQQGEAKNNDLSSYTGNLTGTIKFNNRAMLNIGASGSVRNVDGYAFGVNPFNYAYNTSRVIPFYDESGDLYYHDKQGTGSKVISNKFRYKYNIKNELEETRNENQTKTFSFNANFQYEILPSLRYEGQVSGSWTMSDINTYATEKSYYIATVRGYDYKEIASGSAQEKFSPLPYGGLRHVEKTNTQSYNVRNSLSYSKNFDNTHMFNMQLGIEATSTTYNGDYGHKYGYLRYRGETFVKVPLSYSTTYSTSENELYQTELNNTQVINRVNNYLSEYFIAAYNYKHRYVLNFNARLDASNRFGQDQSKKFQPTWSIGGKWNIAEEKFLTNVLWLGQFDVYATYGYQGNAVESISPYLIAKVGGLDTQFGENKLDISSLPYPDLGWEKTNSYDFGVNLSLFSGRLNTTFDYYTKKSDVLSSYDVPYENGVSSSVVSGTRIENSGWEAVLNIVPVRTQNSTLQFSVTTGKNKNSSKQDNKENTIQDYLNGRALVKGVAYSTLYSFKFDRLNEKGLPIIENLNIERTNDPRKYLVPTGKLNPDFSGGLNVMYRYKGWTLNAQFSVLYGGSARLPKLYDPSLFSGVVAPEQNFSRNIIDRWKKEGDEEFTKIPKLPDFYKESAAGEYYVPLPQLTGYTMKTWMDAYNESDIRVAKTDFIKCRNIALTYNFNPEKISNLYLKRLGISASVTNPFLWVADKKWDKMDPETGGWPPAKVYTLSLNLSF